MRVVSLFPSGTELVAGIGAVDDLVGRSHQCDYPEAVRELPAVTASKLSARASTAARDIDAVVDDHGHGEGTYFRVLDDTLQAVHPDVLITQKLCDVCAVPESMAVETLDTLDPTPELVTLGPTRIGEILDAVGRLGTALDRPSAADSLRDRLERRIERVRQGRDEGAGRPRVVCLEWTAPLRCHGLWIPDSIERLGAEVGFGQPGERGRSIEWPEIRAYDPDVLIVSPCGRTIPGIHRDMEHLVDRPGWDGLSAVEDGRVFLLDGKISSRHGPRVIRSMELIAKMLYPASYPDVEYSSDEAVNYGESDIAIP